MTFSITRRTSLGWGLSFSAALLLGSMASAHADALGDIAKKGSMKVGIFEDFPPFASLGADMKIAGYDTEMADALGKALGTKVELVGITGQNRIPFLTEGKVDLLLSIGFSDERAQVVDFTSPMRPITLWSWGRVNLR